jgi:hypothetical protein
VPTGPTGLPASCLKRVVRWHWTGFRFYWRLMSRVREENALERGSRSDFKDLEMNGLIIRWSYVRILAGPPTLVTNLVGSLGRLNSLVSLSLPSCTPLRLLLHLAHFDGSTANTRTGPPEPPASLIGAAIKYAPHSGSESVFARFSRLYRPAGKSIRCTSKSFEPP